MVPIPDRLEKGKDGEKHGMLQGGSQRSLPVLSSASPVLLRDGVISPPLHPGPEHKVSQTRTGRDPEHRVPGSRQKHIFLSCWDWDNWGIKENAFLTYFLSD